MISWPCLASSLVTSARRLPLPTLKSTSPLCTVLVLPEEAVRADLPEYLEVVLRLHLHQLSDE